MSLSLLRAFATAATFFAAIAAAEAQEAHKHESDMHRHSEKIAPRAKLQPAEGARVKIVAPKDGQVIAGDKVPLQFTLVKGKHGEHVHAYVDGELVGMFHSEKGTLNGIQPGRHTLEVRVATGNHNTELDATDNVSFTTK
jgi:hypothetical protein